MTGAEHWYQTLSNEATDSNEPQSEASAGDLEVWVQASIDAAEDKLGRDSKAFYVGDVMGICDWFVVTSAASERQVRAIVDEIEEKLMVAGGPKPTRIEGKSELSWVLMDYGMFVVHVFTDDAREYYDLERLWSDVPTFGTAAADATSSASTRLQA